MSGAHVHDVVIVGGGISGIGSVIALREAGIEDVLVLERDAVLGGTWRDNTYPGCACDVPSALYSWTREPNPGWTRVFARRDEIQRYVLGVAEAHGVPAVSETGVEVLDAAWDAATAQWVVTTSAGERRGRAIIVAAGPLHEPRLPDGVLPTAFAGPAFHSSRWDHDVALEGKRVAVIGTGASCVQFLPHVRRQASHVTVLQRTPGWVMPKPDRRISPRQRALLRRLPVLQKAIRQGYQVMFDAGLLALRHPRFTALAHALGHWNIRQGVKDPALRKALTPRDVLGCKRPMVSNHYYRALGKPNVTLVPHGLADVTATSVIAADGSEHDVDVVIYATGFHVSDLPITSRIRAADGTSMADRWGSAPRALYGTTVAGFPNAFMIFGPNIGTISAFVMLESQLRYITSALHQMRTQGLAAITVREDAVEGFKSEVERRLDGSVWSSGCSSYYLDGSGGNYSVWPGTMREMQRRLKRCDLGAYDVVSA